LLEKPVHPADVIARIEYRMGLRHFALAA
jgi:hypothetical protein